MTSRQQLEAEGWKRMSVYDEPRLSALADQYRELDFEVHPEPIHPDELEDCSHSIIEEPKRYRTLYVRKKDDPSESDLFSDE